MVETKIIFGEVVLAAALSMLFALIVWLIGGFISCQGSPKNPTEMLDVNSRTVSVAEAKEPEKAKKKKKHKKKHEEKVEAEVEDDLHYSSSYFMQMGELYDDEWRYTWYSENVLPGGGLDIPGRHVDGEGYVVDSEERLVAASEDIPYGTEIRVPFGSGVAVVRDCGCPSGTIDIYVSW